MEPVSPATAVDVEQLSLDGLHKLQAEVERAITRKRRAKQSQALVEISRLITEAELTAEAVTQHLSGKTTTRRGSGKLPPKYRDPHNPQNTWAGRGKRPKWLQRKLDDGALLEDFSIATATEVQNAGPARIAAP